MLWNGTIPSKDYVASSYLQNLMVGALYPHETLPKEFISTLIEKDLKGWLKEIRKGNDNRKRRGLRP